MKKLARLTAALLAVAVVTILSTSTVVAAEKPPVGKINLNSASAEALTALPGVGEKLAARIVEYRQKSGGFKRTLELMNVRGIGEKNFAKLQEHIVVEARAGRGEKPGAGKAPAARNDN